jgi:outer membrane receptor for ferrienterochelin and colicins
MNHRLIMIFIVFLTIALSSHSQKTDAHIFGHVICYDEHIPGIHVYVKGTQIGTVTDRTGHYFIYNLPVGEHTIVASGIGFKPQEQQIIIKQNTTIEVDFELKEDVKYVSEVVITGSRIEQDRKDVPVIVNIITSDLLVSNQSLTLADGLNFQSGLRVENSCQNCGFQQIRINGLEGPYTQILIDGKPLISSLAAVYGLEQIPISMIHRIEVVKGGGSATYGSNAIAGTINIITRDPLFNSFQLAHNISAFTESTFDNTSFFNATVINNGNSGGFTFFGNVRNRQALDYDLDGYTEIPVLKSTAVGFKTFNRLSKQSKITFEYHNISDFRRGGNKLSTVPHLSDVTEQAEHKINSVSGVFDLLFKENKGKFSLFTSFRHTERNTYYGTGMNPYAYGSSLDQVFNGGIEYVRFLDSKLLPYSWLFGSDMVFNDLTDKQLGYNRNIHQATSDISMFTQGQWKFGLFSFLAGVRGDKHNFLNKIMISPRLNILLSARENWQLRGGLSTGFRAPQAFDEDFHILAIGGEVQLIELDEDLHPETSVSYTVSSEWTPNLKETSFLILTEAFLTNLNDVFILENGGTDISGNSIMVRTNGKGAKVYGINFEFKVSPHHDLNFLAGFTVQKSQYSEPVQWSEDSDAELVNRMFKTPEQYGYASMTARSKKDLFLTLSVIYTGSMLIPHYAGYIASDRIEKTPSFADINIRTSKIFNLSNQLNVEAAVGVKNFLNSFQSDFDQGNQRDAGYLYGPIYPRHIYFSLKFGNIR